MKGRKKFESLSIFQPKAAGLEKSTDASVNYWTLENVHAVESFSFWHKHREKPVFYIAPRLWKAVSLELGFTQISYEIYKNTLSLPGYLTGILFMVSFIDIFQVTY